MKSQPEPDPRSCNLCGSAQARELYTAKDHLSNSDEVFSICECVGCGVLRTLPAMSSDELAKYYPADYWGEVSVPSQKWIYSSQLEKTQFLSRCGLRGGTILDVGCGAGYFLRALDPNHWNRYGVEIGELASRAATAALGTGRVFTGTLIESEWADEAFDVVIFWSALEHTNEPRANLLETKRILKRGGTLIVQVPNAASYQARAFGSLWSALDAPRHRYHFTRQTLGRLLPETGFKIYQSTLFSRSHNAHALRQSLKATLQVNRSALGLPLFLLSTPFIKPFDWLMTSLGLGATLTVAAHSV
jgi:2-polyprenyl-3-methyl-5-hydroxy-6-metoxy-1,4-benzoquinol methylase